MKQDDHSQAMNEPRFDWRRALREITLIFAGVMAALGVRAWWGSHEEQRRLTRTLMAVQTDLRATAMSLDSTVKLDSISLASARRMQGFLTSDSTQLPPGDSIVEWLRLNDPRFEPVGGSIDQLVRSGDLNLIHDSRLRRDLVAYSGAVQTAAQQASVAEQGFEQQSALARERVQTHAHWKGSWRTLMASHTATYDVKGMRDDAMLRAAYMNAIMHQATHIQVMRKVRRQTHALLTALGEKSATKDSTSVKKPGVKTPNAKPQPAPPRPGNRKQGVPRPGSSGVIT